MSHQVAMFASEWTADCACGEKFTATSLDAVDALWRAHMRQLGKKVRPVHPNTRSRSHPVE